MDILGLMPPKAMQQSHIRDTQGEQFVDPYEWMRDKDSPATQEYIAAQNAYTDKRMAPLASLRQSLFTELTQRVQETDDQIGMLPEYSLESQVGFWIQIFHKIWFLYVRVQLQR